MMLPALPMMLAATASLEPAPEDAGISLEVTATVIRPVEISAAVGSDGAVVTIRNTIGVEVLAVDVAADNSVPGTIILTGDGAAPMVITLVY